MVAHGCQEVVLETEFDNVSALRFYRKFGFIKDKKLYRFYLNAKDAYRLKLPLGSSLTDSEQERRKAAAAVEERLESSRSGSGSPQMFVR